MTKYQPLMDFMVGKQGPKLHLSFKEIERTLGFPLPNSARKHAPWWSNHAGGHVQSKAWLNAGWRTEEIDLSRERVEFVRKNNAPSRELTSSLPSAPSSTNICVDQALLTPPALRLFRDYQREMNGDASAALARAVHEAAVARRGRLIDHIVANATRMPPGEPDSVQLIREDRDAR